jgi:hypothetical protein
MKASSELLLNFVIVSVTKNARLMAADSVVQNANADRRIAVRGRKD